MRTFAPSVTRRVVAALLIAVSPALAWPEPALADRADQDEARRAVQAGDALPLSDILARVSRDHPGKVLRVELEREDRQWVYEIRLLRPDGGLVKLKRDARTGDPLMEPKAASDAHRSSGEVRRQR